MAERRLPIPERPWHKSKSGRWCLSLGVRGLKVRVQQHKPGGTFQRVFRVGRRVSYASLGTTDRKEARRLAVEFIREIEKGKKINLAEPLTLEKLWDRYQQEASSYRGNLERTRKQKQTDVRLLIAGLGAARRGRTTWSGTSRCVGLVMDGRTVARPHRCEPGRSKARSSSCAR